MTLATLIAKTSTAQACMADLHRRGIDHLVESVYTSSTNPTPIIRLNRDPKCVIGGSIVRRGKDRRRVIGASHLGCQLRWEVPAQ